MNVKKKRYWMKWHYLKTHCILNYWTLFLSKDCLFLIFTITSIHMSLKLLRHLCQHFYWKCHVRFGILCHISLPKEIGQFYRECALNKIQEFCYLVTWILLVLWSVWYLLIQISIFDSVVCFLVIFYSVLGNFFVFMYEWFWGY